MKKPAIKLLDQIAPFIMIGIGIVVAIGFLLILSTLFFWGLLIGLVLYTISYIRKTFFMPKTPSSPKKGRIIEHD